MASPPVRCKVYRPYTQSENAIDCYSGAFASFGTTAVVLLPSSKELSRFDAKELSWKKKQISGEFNSPSAGHCIVMDYADHCIVVGGSHTNFSELYEIDVKTGHSKRMKMSLPPTCTNFSVSGHTCASYNIDLYSFGGFKSMGGAFKRLSNELWKFSPALRKMELVVPADSTDAPSPRTAHCSAVVKNLFINFGGLTSKGVSNELFALDLDTKIWRKLDTSGPSPSPRYNASLCSTASNDLVLLGGNTGLDWLQDLWIFSTSSETWSQVDIASPLPPISNAFLLSDLDIVYILGGIQEIKPGSVRELLTRSAKDQNSLASADIESLLSKNTQLALLDIDPTRNSFSQLPHLDPLINTAAKTSQIMIKLMDYNTEIEELSGGELSLDQPSLLVLEMIMEASADGGTASAAAQLNEDHCGSIVHDLTLKLLRWPVDKLLPVLDMARLAITNDTFCQYIQTLYVATDGHADLLQMIVQAAYQGQSRPANRIMALRFIANLFKSPHLHGFLLSKVDYVYEATQSSQKSPELKERLAAADVFFNYGTLFCWHSANDKKTKHILTLLLSIVSETARAAAADEAIMYRLLVALGTSVVFLSKASRNNLLSINPVAIVNDAAQAMKSSQKISSAALAVLAALNSQ